MINPEIENVLGRGQFGEVRIGEYKHKEICIKTCKPQNYSDDEIERLVFISFPLIIVTINNMK